MLAQRRPSLHRLLDAEDEAFAALMLLVVSTPLRRRARVSLRARVLTCAAARAAQEYHSLTACDASVAESFYGACKRSTPLPSR